MIFLIWFDHSAMATFYLQHFIQKKPVPGMDIEHQISPSLFQYSQVKHMQMLLVNKAKQHIKATYLALISDKVGIPVKSLAIVPISHIELFIISLFGKNSAERGPGKCLPMDEQRGDDEGD